MNCLLVMKIKWNLDINTAGATVVGDDVIASTGYMKKQPCEVQGDDEINTCNVRRNI